MKSDNYVTKDVYFNYDHDPGRLNLTKSIHIDSNAELSEAAAINLILPSSPA